MSNTMPGAAGQTPAPTADDARIKRAQLIFLLILAAGVLTTVVVGVIVTYFVQLSGQPNMEWPDVFHQISRLLIPVVISWLPFVLLAWVARYRFLRTGFVEGFVYGALVGGEIGALWFFGPPRPNIVGVGMATAIVYPILMFIVGGMLIGAGTGWLMSGTRRRVASQTPAPEPGEVQVRKAQLIFFLILVAGFLTPIIVGIAVLYYLDVSGQPHLQWPEVFQHLTLLLMPVIVSLFPFALLAKIAKGRFLRKGSVERTVYGAFAGGEIGTIWLFWQAWASVEGATMAAILLFPIWIPIIGGMLIGSGIGWLTNVLWPAHRTLPT